MSNPIQLNGGSYSSAEIIAAIAASNDPTVDLSEVNQKLDFIVASCAALNDKVVTIENRLVNLPTTWSIG